MYPQNIFSLEDKKNINTFLLKKKKKSFSGVMIVSPWRAHMLLYSSVFCIFICFLFFLYI